MHTEFSQDNFGQLHRKFYKFTSIIVLDLSLSIYSLQPTDLFIWNTCNLLEINFGNVESKNQNYYYVIN